MRVLRTAVIAFGGAAAALVVLLLAPGVASAQAIYQSVHDFTQGPGHPIGRLLEATDGKVYGVTSIGGAHRGGSIFSAERSASGVWTTSTLHQFAPADGSNPAAGLAEGPDGLLYGTTSNGGRHGAGTIFRISKAGAFQLLHSFNAAVDGARPLLEPLTLAGDGAFYGTASAGGIHGLGTVFRISTAGAFSVVRAFSGFDGAFPAGGVVRGLDGALYGTTRHGGHLWQLAPPPPWFPGAQAGVGTVFRITTTGTHTILHSFGDANAQSPFWTQWVNDGFPLGGLVQGGDGFFYGVTSGGGSTVYRVGVGSAHAIVTRLGAAPTLARGRNGAVYMLDASLRLQQIHPLLVAEYTPTAAERAGAGAVPAGGIVQVADGAWLGTTSQMALGGQGALLTIGGGPPATMTTVTAFNSNGYSPTGTLKPGPGGMLYGTTSHGGPNNCGTGGSLGGCGTVFRLAAGAAPAVEHLAFSSINQPLFGDVEITIDGTIWAAQLGAPSKAMSLAGIELPMPSSFQSPHAPLEASDGQLYGFAEGTSLTPSTLIRQAPGGAVTTLTSMGTRPPFAALMETSGGALCGTMPNGFPQLWGEVFCYGVGSMWLDGFGGTLPLGRLVEGGDGFLYGTTYAGGPQFDGDTDSDGIPSGYGVVFKVAPDMSGFAVVHPFSPAGGIHPYAGLTAGPGNVLYGTTSRGGQHGVGTVFSISAEGTYTVLHSFSVQQGHVPIGGVVFGTDGALYGTTLLGGSGNAGSVYRIVLPELVASGQRD